VHFDQPYLHAGAIPNAAGEIVFAEHVRGERATDFAAARRKPECGLRFRCIEAACSGKRRSGKADIRVVIGETLHDTVTTREPPAMAERRDRGGEACSEIGWD